MSSGRIEGGLVHGERDGVADSGSQPVQGQDRRRSAEEGVRSADGTAGRSEADLIGDCGAALERAIALACVGRQLRSIESSADD